MGWFDRLGRVIRSRVNDLIQETEDPEKILEQALLDMEQELISMRQALAEAVATKKRTERQLLQQQKTAGKWHDHARLALEHGQDDLAREALTRWQDHQYHIAPLEKNLLEQGTVIDRLKRELLTIERQYTEMRAQKSLYVARLRSASASQKAREILGDLNTSQNARALERLEAKVIEMEALSGTVEIADPLERKFRELEEQKRVETEFKKLKKNSER